MTQEEAAMLILKEINTSLVDWSVFDSTSAAIQCCFDDDIFDMLSGGEKVLAKMALNIYTGNTDLGPGFPALGKLDFLTRRRVWMVVGSLYGMEPH